MPTEGVIAVVCARFNETVTHALLRGALETLRQHGMSDERVQVVWVPGCFELPLAAQALARREDVLAVICIGAVIRGETPHFEFVSDAAATGILRVSLDAMKPVTFGVLTTDTTEQAFARAGGRAGNKGTEAARAAVEMVELLFTLRENQTKPL
ncbi:6,7-dimethyl-8-ribityllumazine synthase [candidate division KSB1 bacterium]|nr:6,7-dimethyl-8-ribityllumazine synthase [candidate division KSB1 bacterium]